MSRLMTKSTKWHVRPAKTQISLGSVQSDQSLRCPHKEHLAHSESSGQTGRMLGAQSFCWFCHEVAQISLTLSVDLK